MWNKDKVNDYNELAKLLLTSGKLKLSEEEKSADYYKDIEKMIKITSDITWLSSREIITHTDGAPDFVKDYKNWKNLTKMLKHYLKSEEKGSSVYEEQRVLIINLIENQMTESWLPSMIVCKELWQILTAAKALAILPQEIIKTIGNELFKLEYTEVMYPSGATTTIDVIGDSSSYSDNVSDEI